MSYLHIERAAEKIDCPFPCLRAQRSDPHITKPRKKTREELTDEEAAAQPCAAAPSNTRRKRIKET